MKTETKSKTAKPAKKLKLEIVLADDYLSGMKLTAQNASELRKFHAQCKRLSGRAFAQWIVNQAVESYLAMNLDEEFAIFLAERAGRVPQEQ